jgi:Thiolase-like protein type 1 additional C-terminal domain
MHDRDGAPVQAIAATLTPDGARAWATSDDAATLARLLEDEEHVGDAAHRTAEGRLLL